MANYITIDGGTTNTRISLVVNNCIIDKLKFNIGAKNTIDDKTALKQILKQSIKNILKNNNIPESKVERILASGMITSELGLIYLPHIEAPVGIEQLHNSLYETTIEDVSAIPFVFVPGVKTHSESFEKSDIMRGEETEFIGLFRGEGIYVLLGSHSKIIIADKAQRIIEFSTTLTGEMIASLSQNTILKDSLTLENVEIDHEFLLKGYEFCKANGINESLFKVRVLKKLFNQNESQIYSFFMGVILCAEVEQIFSNKPTRIVIGGKAPIKKALAILLESTCSATVETIKDEEAEQSTTQGIIKIYEFQER